MPNKKCFLWDVACAGALTGVLTTGMWAELDALGPATWALVALLLTLAHRALKYADWPAVDFSRLKPRRRDLWIAVALLIPLTLRTVLSWNEDFPFGGDHDHHLLATAAAEKFWLKNWLALAAFPAAIYFGAKRARSSLWPFVVFAAMVAASYGAKVPDGYFARYPATIYLFNIPFTALARLSGATSLWNAIRLANVAAPFLWLLWLRPRFGATPAGAGWLILAVFFLGQRDSLYFIDSVYLETWPLVFLLLALDALFDLERPVWIAPLWAAAACAFKDTATLPFLAVGAAALWRGRASAKQLATVLAAGTIGLIPFLVYYLERQRTNVWRTLEIAPFDQSLTRERFAIFGFRLLEQFWWPGLIGILVVSSVGLAYALWRGGPGRGPALIVAAGGLAQFAIFFADKISLPFPGYPRFLLSPWAMVLAPTYLLPKRFAHVVALAFGAALLPALIGFFASYGGPAYHRNFTEDYAAPIFTPLRALVDAARADLRDGQVIRWVRSNAFEKPFVLSLAYRDLTARYAWESVAPDGPPERCRCVPGRAVLISTNNSRNLHARSPYAPFPTKLNEVSPECLAEADRTCACRTVGDPVEGRTCVWR